MFELIVGCMGSGKSASLISEYEFVKQTSGFKESSILIFKPSVDTRSGEFVTSRNGSSIRAHQVDSFTDILKFVRNLEVEYIFIDELQFLELDGLRGLYVECERRDIYVCASGLNLTSELKTFKTTGEFMCYCDNIIYVHGKCKVCGKPSELSDYSGIKTVDVEVGDGKYYGTCVKCHSMIGEKNDKR